MQCYQTTNKGAKVSADNYGVVHRTQDGKFGLSMGFASDDMELSLDRPYFYAESLREVVQFADEEYFEYGWSYAQDISERLMDLAENVEWDGVESPPAPIQMADPELERLLREEEEIERRAGRKSFGGWL